MEVHLTPCCRAAVNTWPPASPLQTFFHKGNGGSGLGGEGEGGVNRIEMIPSVISDTLDHRPTLIVAGEAARRNRTAMGVIASRVPTVYIWPRRTCPPRQPRAAASHHKRLPVSESSPFVLDTADQVLLSQSGYKYIYL